MNRGKFKVPSLEEQPAYREESERYRKLEFARSEVSKRHSALADKLRGIKPQSEAESLRRRRVLELAGQVADKGEGEATEDHAELSRLRSSIAEHDSALKIVAEKLANERLIASRAICDEIRPTYVKAVERIVAALLELDQASASYQSIIDGLNRENIAFTGHLRPMGVAKWLGKPLDPLGRIASYIREGIEHRLLNPNALPREYRRNA